MKLLIFYHWLKYVRMRLSACFKDFTAHTLSCRTALLSTLHPDRCLWQRLELHIGAWWNTDALSCLISLPGSCWFCSQRPSGPYLRYCPLHRVDTCHKVTIHLGERCQMDVTATMKTRTGDGLLLRIGKHEARSRPLQPGLKATPPLPPCRTPSACPWIIAET